MLILREFKEDLPVDKDDDGKPLNDYSKWKNIKFVLIIFNK
jgi:hypothetical protein